MYCTIPGRTNSGELMYSTHWLYSLEKPIKTEPNEKINFPGTDQNKDDCKTSVPYSKSYLGNISWKLDQLQSKTSYYSCYNNQKL